MGPPVATRPRPGHRHWWPSRSFYRRLLPQPLLRTVLADDPGAGKTIMAGLLLKRLKLRGVVERALVVAPAPLTLQWQDELHDKFDEWFVLIDGNAVRNQLGGNPWARHPQVVTSLDFVKQEDVMPEPDFNDGRACQCRSATRDQQLYRPMHNMDSASYRSESILR